MNRICILKATKRILEMQSGGDDRPDLMEMRLNTLKQNALNAGHLEADIEAKWVTDEEWAVIQEANKPIPTYADLRRAAYPSQYDYLDGIVKDDQGQVKKYILDCLAVKAKYPKG